MGGIDRLKERVAHQQSDHVGLGNSFAELSEPEIVPLRQDRGQGRDMRLRHKELERMLLRKLPGDLYRWTLAKVVDIGLVGKAEQRDCRLAKPNGTCGDPFRNVARLAN